jgi:hypothetical protein
MPIPARAILEFDPTLDVIGKGKELRDGLSVVVAIGNALWVANDETVSLERLELRGVDPDGTQRFGGHGSFPLDEYIRLPVPVPRKRSRRQDVEEADIEGLDFSDGYLWVIGSHSLKRARPEPGTGFRAGSQRLATVSSDGNRFLLARIPIDQATGLPARKVERNDRRLTAAQLRGDDEGSELTEALAKDEHIGPFLEIPGKDNGFDIEGLAVAGDRVFIGLRGPVLRGWSIVLELEVRRGANRTLRLKRIGRRGRPYRKHFLHLAGLGIRDLCVRGEDLLILAGPTMDLDGPVRVLRWAGGAASKRDSLVFADGLETVVEVPYGVGVDHAEGMAVANGSSPGADSLIVVYDAASEARQPGPSAMIADVFPLPG